MPNPLQSREDPFTSQQGNGWTQYQKLVLAELERHENKLNTMHEELVELRIDSGSIKKDILNLNTSIDKISTQLDDAEKTQTTNSIDLNKLKWRVGAISSIISTIFTVTVTVLLKLFLHM